MPSNKLPKSTRNRPKGLPYYGGPARGSSNKFPAAYYLTARHLNCEYCGHKVYSGSRNTSKVSLMLRHWAHSNACKQIRAASGIVVDQYISEDSLQWEEVPNLDISDEIFEGGGEQEFGLEERSETDELSEDARPLFSDGKDPTGDSLYPAVTAEQLKFSATALGVLGDNVLTNDPYLVEVKSDIAEIQRQFLDKFDPSAEPPITFRNNTEKGTLDDVNPSDLIDILEFGIEVGLSNSQGDKLITLIKRLFARRNIPIQLRNEYESMKRSLSTNITTPMFPIQRFVFPLPVEYFGDTDPATGSELKAIESVALNPMNVLAESLLRIEDPGNFLRTFDSQLASIVSDDGRRRIEEIPRERQILGDFSTGNLWRSACADARRYRCIDPSDTRRIVHLMLGVWGDVACLNASKTKSEGGVYMSILNTTDSDYKMHFIGYAPIHFPYTNDKLKSLLIARGFESEAFNKEIIATTKKRAMRAYIAQIFGSLCEYGRNCYLVQIGKGREAKTLNAIVNVVQLGGDGEHCDGLLQIHHGRYANCRICLDNRHSKFCRCDDEAEMRDDALHEDLCAHVQEVTQAKAASYATRAAASLKPLFMRSAAQLDIETKARDCGVGTSASYNPLYQLFWYWNSRGIYSLHRSATPDLLHAILKGIIEKTVTWALMTILLIQGMDVYKGAYKGNMTLLDDRSRFFKVMGWSMNLRCVF